MRMRFAILGFFAAVIAVVARADMGDEIVVTAMRSEGYGEMPAVTVSQPADFLVQEIRLVNDSRSPDLRKKEIVATIGGMLKRAARERGIALSYGEGFLVPVNLSDDSLAIIEDKKRVDTSSVDIYVKVNLVAGDDAKTKIANLRKFIEDTQRTGRTEIEPLGDVGLSIVDPEKYRYDILAKIAQENERLTKAMGKSCQVKIGGLEGRVQWERTDVAELTLYIPYGVEVSQCMYQP